MSHIKPINSTVHDTHHACNLDLLKPDMVAACRHAVYSFNLNHDIIGLLKRNERNNVVNTCNILYKVLMTRTAFGQGFIIQTLYLFR